VKDVGRSNGLKWRGGFTFSLSYRLVRTSWTLIFFSRRTSLCRLSLHYKLHIKQPQQLKTTPKPTFRLDPLVHHHLALRFNHGAVTPRITAATSFVTCRLCDLIFYSDWQVATTVASDRHKSIFEKSGNIRSKSVSFPAAYYIYTSAVCAFVV